MTQQRGRDGDSGEVGQYMKQKIKGVKQREQVRYKERKVAERWWAEQEVEKAQHL